MGGSVEVVEAQGLEAPRFVLPNGAGLAYGEFHLDPRSLEWLEHNLPAIGDPLTRGSAWVSLWDAMLNAEVRPAGLIDLRSARAAARDRRAERAANPRLSESGVLAIHAGQRSGRACRARRDGPED